MNSLAEAVSDDKDTSISKIATNLQILRQQLYDNIKARSLLDDSITTLHSLRKGDTPSSIGTQVSLFGLTDREVQVLDLLVQGERPQFIANSLAISINTVRRHLSSIFKKLDVNSQIECIEKFR